MRDRHSFGVGAASVGAALTLLLTGIAMLGSDSPPGASTASLPERVVNHAPAQRINATDADNWAGYDAAGGTYTSVSASWVEPKVKCSSDDSTAFWVGIDGGKQGDDTVEQTGTSRTRPGTG